MIKKIKLIPLITSNHYNGLMNKAKPVLRRYPGILTDRNGQYYYYVAKSKIAYFIKPEDMKLAEVLAYRLYIAVSIGVVLFSIMKGNWWFYFILSVAVYGLLEWYTRFKMPLRCREVSPYQITITKSRISETPTKQVYLKLLVYLVAAVLLVLTIMEQHNTGLSLAVLAAMVGICLLGALQNILILTKKRD